MELFSRHFSEAVKEIFRLQDVIVLATIPIARGKPLSLVEELRNNDKCMIIEVGTSVSNSTHHPTTINYSRVHLT